MAVISGSEVTAFSFEGRKLRVAKKGGTTRKFVPDIVKAISGTF